MQPFTPEQEARIAEIVRDTLEALKQEQRNKVLAQFQQRLIGAHSKEQLSTALSHQRHPEKGSTS